jgi:hypothetical protein
MESKRPVALISFIIILQVLNLLTLNIDQGLILLASLTALLGYLTYNDTLKLVEAGISTVSFISTGLVISFITKQAVVDVCKTAKVLQDFEGSSALPQSEACRSVFQIWIDFLGTNPVTGWEFWSITLAVSIGSIQLYRKINERRNQVD